MALTRSEQMSRIRSGDTKPERLLAKKLWVRGLRYRLRARTPWGRPDFLFAAQRVAVFVDGCFWHGCPEHYVRPRTRVDFWSGKLAENVHRDQAQTAALEEAGWRVLRFWEHEVFTRPTWVADRVRRACTGGQLRRRKNMRVLSAWAVSADGNLERRVLVSLRRPRLRRTAKHKRHTRKW